MLTKGINKKYISRNKMAPVKGSLLLKHGKDSDFHFS